MLFNERVLLDIAREQQRDRPAEAEAFRLAGQFEGDDDFYPKLRQWLAGQVGNLLIVAGTRLHAHLDPGRDAFSHFSPVSLASWFNPAIDL